MPFRGKPKQVMILDPYLCFDITHTYRRCQSHSKIQCSFVSLRPTYASFQTYEKSPECCAIEISSLQSHRAILTAFITGEDSRAQKVEDRLWDGRQNIVKGTYIPHNTRTHPLMARTSWVRALQNRVHANRGITTIRVHCVSKPVYCKHYQEARASFRNPDQYKDSDFDELAYV